LLCQFNQDMDVRTVNSVNSALQAIVREIDLQEELLDSKHKEEYSEYFDAIRRAAVKAADQFFTEYIHNSSVQKNILK
jgi:hypothetical protein